MSPPPVFPMTTPRIDISINDNPAITVWKTNNTGAINIKANSTDSVIPETNVAATPAINSAFTASFLSLGVV